MQSLKPGLRGGCYSAAAGEHWGMKGKLTLSPSDGAISCAQSGDEAAWGGLPGRMGRLESRPLAPPGPSLAALVCHPDSGFRLRFHRAQGSPAPEDEHHLS